MTTTIAVEKSALRAIAMFAADKDEIRYYMKGVCLEVGRDESRLIATDGHRLAIYRIAQSSEVDETKQYIIPIELLKNVKRAGKRDAISYVLIEVDGDNVTVRDPQIGASLTAKRIDATYPDWGRITRGLKCDGTQSHFNADYIAGFAKAATEFGGSGTSVVMAHNGTGPAIVTLTCDANFFAVLMPMRQHEPVKATPAWVSQGLTPAMELAQAA